MLLDRASAKIGFVAAIFLLTEGVYSSQGMPVNLDGALRRVGEHIRAEMALNGIPGLVIAVVREGEVVYAKAFGVADASSGRPMTTSTLIELASVSKSFTALAVRRLEVEGGVQLERPVYFYLPEFRTRDVNTSRQITVRDLLRHTSGFSRHADWRVPCCGMPEEGNLEVAVRTFQSASLTHPPGLIFRYANSNYILLAAIVEAVAGKPFTHYMREEVFRPLGLTRTTFQGQEAEQWGLARLHERQWGKMKTSASRYIGWYGSSRIKSNAEDMAGYMLALLSEQTDPVSRLLPARELCRAEAEYDRGWQIIREKNGPCILKHGGNIWGANTAVVLFPEQELGVTVLINTGIYRAEEIAQAAAGYLFGWPVSPPARVHWSVVSDNWAIGFTLAAVFMNAVLIAYCRRILHQLKTGQRQFFREVDWLCFGRSLLLFGMSIYLLYLILGGAVPPRVSFPATMQIAYPFFAGSLSVLLLVLAIFSLAPRRRGITQGRAQR